MNMNTNMIFSSPTKKHANIYVIECLNFRNKTSPTF